MTSTTLSYSQKSLALDEPPKQIAYYSRFPGETDEYRYQSSQALKPYRPPRQVPFEFSKAPDRKSWVYKEMCKKEDSVSQQGSGSIVTSCERAGRSADLADANVITRKDLILEYVSNLAAVTSG